MKCYHMGNQQGEIVKYLVNLFKNQYIQNQQMKLYRDWDRMRDQARTPSERAEIDAIFSRHL
jgi:hypothetical protein